MSPLAEPLAHDELRAHDKELIHSARKFMGFDSNDALTMARVPGLLSASATLVAACYQEGKVSPTLKRRMAYLSSRASGCRYCQAHTANGAELAADEVEDLWTFEASDRYSDAEKAALALAVEAASQEPPSQNTVERVRMHYDPDAVSELVAILALFGFLNRWNTLMGTTLEETPLGFAETTLAPSGWQPGSHGPADKTE